MLITMGLLRFFLIIFSIYLTFRVLTTYIFPWLVKRSVRKYQERFYEQNPHLKPDQPRKDGQVTIEKVGREESGNVPENIGEYTEYEDIK
ncbi:MAG: hypothetical protein VB072_05475 [Lentimicrobium sp.]|nr:hypothetical protein [Lentimicrobium sp.]MEA5109860.1 hypothetical protein [Lentimicrobium sp.]